MGNARRVRQIATEQFVRAVAGNGDFDMARHELRQEIRGDDTRKRLVEQLKIRRKLSGKSASSMVSS